MIEEIEKEIKGYKYLFKQLPARQNIMFAAKWAKQFKPLAALMKALSKAKTVSDLMDSDISDLDFSGMFESICENLEPDKFSSLVFDSFRSIKVITEECPNGVSLNQELSFDLFYAGKLDHIMIVLFEIVKFNIFGGNSDFFTKIITRAKQSQIKKG